MNIENNLKTILNKEIKDATNQEIYQALFKLSNEAEAVNGDRKVYYISSEFLIGKLLSNNLINLHIYDEVKAVLESNGKSLEELEELENEPSLGNGGLGRLAACFLDSMATLEINGCGVSLNYHYGLFKQEFKDNKQLEKTNPWIDKNSFLNETDEKFVVEFGDFSLESKMFEVDVIGYTKKKVALKLFDVPTVVDKSDDSTSFDKTDIKNNLTLFLYPDDSDEAGHLLRIYQQYFMVSNGAQLVIKEYLEKHEDLRNLHKHAVIQINDTHPSLVIPELVYQLSKHGISFSEAVEIVKNTCSYTNHTILAEALEKWPLHYLEKVVPHLVPIIKELDSLVREMTDNANLYIIKDDIVHMAHLDIHYSYSVNGVAALHTDILKTSELKEFSDFYPGKFNNKTNGITFRRWLFYTNPQLTKYLSNLLGDEFKLNLEKLGELLNYKDDAKVLNDLMDIKQEKKQELAEFIKHNRGIEIDTNSIFDIQIKRLHEYKRQQMNVLFIIDQYLKIKAGKKPSTPVTYFFGAKAASAYTIAKDIIHLILCLENVINNDPEVNKYMKVVMVENYNVSAAQKLIPACDISEQISLASKEASGTGNMKFMLNGALTLGTLDGANVEIDELVGRDNIFIFGKSSDYVIDSYKNSSYVAKEYYEHPEIKKLVDFIISDEVLAFGDKENLTRLHNELINKDWFMTLLDIEEYIEVKEACFSAYEDKTNWAKMALVNIAKASYFSSDRTIQNYNDDIWKIK